MALMIARILSALVGLAFIALTLVFFSIIVALAVAAALLLGAWAWWRGSLKVEVRRGRGRGEVVEGQYRVIDHK